jgi:hypothetical protein
MNLQEWYDDHMKTVVEQAKKAQQGSSDETVQSRIQRLMDLKKIYGKLLILRDLQVKAQLKPYPETPVLKCPICEGELKEDCC